MEGFQEPQRETERREEAWVRPAGPEDRARGAPDPQAVAAAVVVGLTLAAAAYFAFPPAQKAPPGRLAGPPIALPISAPHAGRAAADGLVPLELEGPPGVPLARAAPPPAPAAQPGALPAACRLCAPSLDAGFTSDSPLGVPASWRSAYTPGLSPQPRPLAFQEGGQGVAPQSSLPSQQCEEPPSPFILSR